MKNKIDKLEKNILDILPKKLIGLLIDMTDFERQVCEDCYRITGEKSWNGKVYRWFYRMDFIPGNWRDLYLEFVKSK